MCVCLCVRMRRVMIGHIASNPYHYCPYTHMNIYNMHTIIITRRCHDIQPTVKLPNWSRQKNTHTQQIQPVQRCWIKSTHSTDCHTHARASYTKLVECYNKSANPNSCWSCAHTHFARGVYGHVFVCYANAQWSFAHWQQLAIDEIDRNRSKMPSIFERKKSAWNNS